MWGEGKARQKPHQALFHSGKELGSLSDTKYTVHSFRWEVGRLPSGNPQYFERQQIVSYKLKNQNARSKHEARINFFPLLSFFPSVWWEGKHRTAGRGKGRISRRTGDAKNSLVWLCCCLGRTENSLESV